MMNATLEHVNFSKPVRQRQRNGWLSFLTTRLAGVAFHWKLALKFMSVKNSYLAFYAATDYLSPARDPHGLQGGGLII